ncbi:MAG: hypothetical protein WD669_00515 [Pirellulales bacterium]
MDPTTIEQQADCQAAERRQRCVVVDEDALSPLRGFGILRSCGPWADAHG